MADTQRQKERMWGAVAPQLEPGERAVVGAMVQTGPSAWWALLTWIITAVATRYWFLVVTDRRVIILPASKRPKPIQWTRPLGQAFIEDHQAGSLWSGFVLRDSDGGTGKYRYLRRLWAAEMEQIVHAVNGAGRLPPSRPRQAAMPPAQQQGGFTA